MTALPDKNDLVSSSATEVEFQDAIGDVYDYVAQLAMAGEPEAATLDTNGLITPTRCYMQIDTFAGTATDDLMRIVPTNVQSKMLIIRSTSGSRIPTVKHNQSGSGKIMLNGGVDFVLRDPTYILCLLWDDANTRWQEAWRNPTMIFPPAEINQIKSQLGLGTAASVDTGMSTGQIPLKENFGTAAFANTGTSSGQVPLANQLGSLAFLSQVTNAQMDGSGVSPGTYSQVTVNSQGRVTGGANVSSGPFSQFFNSGDYGFSYGGIYTFSHGLGGTPKMVYGELVCLVSEGGWAVGDRIPLTSWIYPANNNTGISVSCNSTQASITMGSSGYWQLYKAGTNRFTLTAANWRVCVKALA